MPTGMGHGIGVPHCRLLSLDHPVVVFSRHRQGVVFGGVDKEPCDLIVLILSGAGAPDEHVKLLGAIAQLLGLESMRSSLRGAASNQDFYEIVQRMGS